MADKPTIGQSNWGGVLNAYLDEQQSILQETQQAVTAAASGPVVVTRLPAGITLSVHFTGTSWPARPTSSTNVTVHWVGGDKGNPPPGALENIDTWDYNAGGGTAHQVFSVFYASGWPTRPTDDPTITIWWIGGSEGTPPTAALDGDIWDYNVA